MLLWDKSLNPELAQTPHEGIICNPNFLGLLGPGMSIFHNHTRQKGKQTRFQKMCFNNEKLAKAPTFPMFFRI